MEKKIKALLLSAGIGSRLRPLTLKTPKCLIKINSKPIIDYWLESLERVGCEAVIVNTHYLHSKVNKFLMNRKKTKMKIKVVFEDKLLGTAGTLIKNKTFFKDSRVLMIHADNMTNFDLSELLKADEKKPKHCLMTMLTFETDTPESCGIVEKDEQMVVKNFFEKVDHPPSNIANGAIYVFDSKILDLLSDKFSSAFDFSKDIIPFLLGKIFTYHTKKDFIDIGTYKNLSRAKITFEKNL